MMYPCDGTTCETIMMVTTTSVYETLNGQQERLEIGYWHSTLEPFRGPSLSVLCGLENDPASVWEFIWIFFSKKCISSRNVWISSWNFFALERPPVLCGLGNKPASVSGLGRGNSVRLTQLLPPQMIRQYRNIWKETAKQFSKDFPFKTLRLRHLSAFNFCNVCSLLWRTSL